MFKTFRRWLYLLAVYPAFFEPLYGLVFYLQYRTPLLNHLTRAYHLDEKIHFPPGFDEHLLPIEAKVGLVQLQKYSNIIQAGAKLLLIIMKISDHMQGGKCRLWLMVLLILIM